MAPADQPLQMRYNIFRVPSLPDHMIGERNGYEHKENAHSGAAGAVAHR